jgi:hypothetical protein
MIKFIKPENLNGAELLTELTNAGVEVKELPYIDGNGDFWLDVKESDKAQTITIVAAHNGTIIPPEPTIEQKLASVGLNVEDLKAALGL